MLQLRVARWQSLVSARDLGLPFWETSEQASRGGSDKRGSEVTDAKKGKRHSLLVFVGYRRLGSSALVSRLGLTCAGYYDWTVLPNTKLDAPRGHAIRGITQENVAVVTSVGVGRAPRAESCRQEAESDSRQRMSL